MSVINVTRSSMPTYEEYIEWKLTYEVKSYD